MTGRAAHRTGTALGLLVLAAASWPAGATAQERFRRTPPLPDAQPHELRLPPIERVTLSNGLTVAAAQRPGSKLVTLQLVIRAGEADSPPDLPGLASLTARMIGKGSKLASADAVENMIEGMGADYSVEVLMDYTVLTFRVLEDLLDRALYVLRLMVLEPSFSERELSSVRRTAYWELYGRKRDAEFLGWRQFLRLLFENHPYQIATYPEDVIKFITAKDISAFYGRFYRPNNSVILISGNINGVTAGNKVSLHFNTWARQAVERTLPAAPPPNSRERICYVETADAQDAAVYVGNVIMDATSPDFYPFLVLKHILGGTTLSRLHRNLRESKSYARYAFCETEFFRSCGVFWARALVIPEFIAPAVREIVRELRAPALAAPGPAEIEEAKSFLIGSLPMRFESLDGFADMMARVVALDLDDSQWDKGPDRLEQVNTDRAREAAQKYLAGPPLVVVVGRPEWLNRHLLEWDNVEVYDSNGALKEILHKGGSR